MNCAVVGEMGPEPLPECMKTGSVSQEKTGGWGGSVDAGAAAESSTGSSTGRSLMVVVWRKSCANGDQ